MDSLTAIPWKRHLYVSDSEQERAVQGVPKLQQASSSSHLQSLMSLWQRVSSVGQGIRSSWSLHKRVLLPTPTLFSPSLTISFPEKLVSTNRTVLGHTGKGTPHRFKTNKAAHSCTESISKEEGRLPGCLTRRVFYDKTASCKPEKHRASHPGA